MDNLSTHKNVRMIEAIKARGAEVVFLPRSSPDFTLLKAHGASGSRQMLCRKGISYWY